MEKRREEPLPGRTEKLLRRAKVSLGLVVYCLAFCLKHILLTRKKMIALHAQKKRSLFPTFRRRDFLLFSFSFGKEKWKMKKAG